MPFLSTLGGGSARGFGRGIGGSGEFSASGGSVITFGSYTLHVFTTVGTYNFDVTGTDGEVDVLVVGGGGGGGMCNQSSNYGGGGGAGGLVWATGRSVTGGTSYSITVGNGGSGCYTTGGQGRDGENSTALGYTALGGGGGGSQYLTNSQGRSGGSGGGGGYPSGTFTGGTGNQPSQSNPGATLNLGNDGGDGDAGPNSGGGGGGAGGAGKVGSNTQRPHGGEGYNMSAFVGTSVGDSGWFAGGGGGSEQNAYGTPYGNGGSGGLGGGGTGSEYDDATQTAGQANTGGGGGAGTSGGEAKAGGSGVVIIRYLTP